MISQLAKSAERHAADDMAAMFDLAPISLWIEDYSGVKAQFDAWRWQGVSDLRAFLKADIGRVTTCAELIRVIGVNRRTLELFEADSLIHLVANLGKVFKGDMLTTHLEELVQLWEAGSTFKSQTVNYTLSGKRLDILLNGAILPGYEDDWARVLVSIDDITEREIARRALAESDAYARGLFDYSPVSLWVEDFSAVKRLLDEVRDCGIVDFRTFIDVHPEFVERCMSEIRIIDINSETMRLFQATDRTEIMLRKHEIFRDAMHQPFSEQLIELWNGKLVQQREIVNYSLNGDELHLLMQFAVLPGHEADWSLVQVGLADITARKKAEAYLEFLGKHDVLTKLHNRSFYVDELMRLQKARISPVSIIIADLNGLKTINDSFGHAAGDQMLRRVGEILSGCVDEPIKAARIGGDEFVIIIPGGNEQSAEKMVDNLRHLEQFNNQYYGGNSVSLSVGAATSLPGESLEETAKRADSLMYADKRLHYAETSR